MALGVGGVASLPQEDVPVLEETGYCVQALCKRLGGMEHTVCTSSVLPTPLETEK